MLQSKPTAAEHHICSKWSHQQTDRLEPTHRGKPQGKRGMDRGERLQANVSRAKQQGEEMIQLKRLKIEDKYRGSNAEREGEIFATCYFFLLQNQLEGRRGGAGYRNGKLKSLAVFYLSSFLPALLASSLTSFLHLCSSLLPVSFLFSETDRTRDACESKDERPVWEGYECM